KDFGERQTSIKKINFKLDVLNDYCIDRMNFYKPTPIFKTRANYEFSKYLTDTIDPWISEDVDFKLCSNYEKDLYIEKYGGVVKNWDFPKNLLYNRNFSYDKKEEENPYAELEHASARAHYLAELGIFGNLESNSETDSNKNESASK
ncbi:12606_t:CDS:2, partial [Gigaspora rosea]